MKVPCEECISLAICRHKKYQVLVRECSELVKYVLNTSGDRARIRDRNKLVSILKPTQWYVDKSGWIKKELWRTDP